MRRLVPVLVLLCAVGVSAQTLERLQSQFEKPPDDARIMMRWWWFGPAMENRELEREMRVMKDAGIGGFEVQATYPLVLDGADVKNFGFLSPEHLNSLHFAADTAKSLGLRMDLTLGSGWPYGGPHISPSLASGKLRVDRVKAAANASSVAVPKIAADAESLIAVFDADGKEIPAAAISAGILRVPASATERENTFFIASRTRQQVKRPAVGAEGPVLDHYSRAALDRHLSSVGDKMLAAIGLNAPYAIFCDSLEVYGADWTSDIPAEFQKRRGYDIRPYLPKLATAGGGLSVADDVLAVRDDWGQTLTELLDDHFFAPLRQWAAAHHTKLRAQAYGTPPAAISTGAQLDLPEGEGVQWKTLSQLRYATSMAHVFGHNVASSETWTWLHSPVFRATPLDMKAEADLHFLQGVNQLVGHGWPYTPPSIEYPGWRFYASAAFGEKNPWWIAMPDIAAYCQRVSFMLRQGRPVNDVAIYVPNHDAWSRFSLGRVDLRATAAELIGPDVVRTVLETGYNPDFVDDGVVQSAKLEGHELRAGNGVYSVIVLPGVERIPTATIRKLEEFTRAGGTVIFTRRTPDKAPGLKATSGDHETVQTIVKKMRAAGLPSLMADDERDGLADALMHRALRDAFFAPDLSDIGFVHRHLESAGSATEIYFVANTGNRMRAFPMEFRGTGTPAQIWNPLTGRVEAARVEPGDNGMRSVVMNLEPYGSRFVIFSKQIVARPDAVVAAVPSPVTLSGDWSVRFEDAAEPNRSPSPETFATLHSLTDDSATRNFSGVAIYEKTLNISGEWLKPGVAPTLTLGEGRAAARTPGMGYQAQYEGPVREAAVVFVNGKRAGSAWCPPYEVDLTGLLHAGENKLEIRVGNLAVNFMAGQKRPDYSALNQRYGERFQAQDIDKIQPVTAGLLGPVQLVVRRAAAR